MYGFYTHSNVQSIIVDWCEGDILQHCKTVVAGGWENESAQILMGERERERERVSINVLKH